MDPEQFNQIMSAIADVKQTVRDDVRNLNSHVTSILKTMQGQMDGMQLQMQGIQRDLISFRIEVRETNELLRERIQRLEGRAA